MTANIPTSNALSRGRDIEFDISSSIVAMPSAMAYGLSCRTMSLTLGTSAVGSCSVRTAKYGVGLPAGSCRISKKTCGSGF